MMLHLMLLLLTYYKTLLLLLFALLTISACEPIKDAIASERTTLTLDCDNLVNLILQDIAEVLKPV